VTGTVVDFPAGVVHGAGVVEHVLDLDGRIGVVTDRTPFHPVDPSWPDQPADLGTLNGLPVVDCLVGAFDADGAIAVDSAIQARRGDPGYTWVVVHVVDGQAPAVGDAVDLQVDAQRRAGLSRAHTGCHVSALALNAVVADLWRKEVVTDGIGNPDFDRIALTSSRMIPDQARDTYRLGKSLRKKGFDTAAFLENLDGLPQRVEAQVQRWMDADANVEIEVDGPHLTDMRRWCCHVPEGTYRIACGGTHVTALRELGSLSVRYEHPDDATVVAVTTLLAD
jgi:alanyl-tRNA synthetase